MALWRRLPVEVTWEPAGNREFRAIAAVTR